MRPWCESCSTRQNQRLTYAWSIGRSSASTVNPVSWSSAWSQAKDYLPPKPPPPEPAPKIRIAQLVRANVRGDQPRSRHEALR
jgi:hypothetical protein